MFAYDKSKLVILCTGGAISGVELKKVLRNVYDIELEMAGVDYAVAMSGAGDTRDNFPRLKTLCSQSTIPCPSATDLQRR